MWHGVINGNNRMGWRGVVELHIDGGSVRGAIRWTSNVGHDGTDEIEGSISGEALTLHSERVANHVLGARIGKCDYGGTLTADGGIKVWWSRMSIHTLLTKDSRMATPSLLMAADSNECGLTRTGMNIRGCCT